MYQKILVFLDGTKEAEQVCGRIQGELAPDGEIVLLRVIPPAKTQKIGEHLILSSQQEESERSSAMVYLRGVAQRHRKNEAGWRCEVAVSTSVPDEVVDFAEREKADLIALYSNDRRGLTRLIRGSSVAEKVRGKTSIETRVFLPQEMAAAAG